MGSRWLLLLLFTLTTSALLAQSPPQSQSPPPAAPGEPSVQSLLDRIQQLESRINQLEERDRQREAAQASIAAPPSPAETPAAPADPPSDWRASGARLRQACGPPVAAFLASPSERSSRADVVAQMMPAVQLASGSRLLAGSPPPPEDGSAPRSPRPRRRSITMPTCWACRPN